MIRRPVLAAALFAALAAPRLRAADTDCRKNESALARSEWLHPLP